MKELLQLFKENKREFFKLAGEGLLMGIMIYSIYLIAYFLQP